MRGSILWSPPIDDSGKDFGAGRGRHEPRAVVRLAADRLEGDASAAGRRQIQPAARVIDIDSDQSALVIQVEYHSRHHLFSSEVTLGRSARSM